MYVVALLESSSSQRSAPCADSSGKVALATTVYTCIWNGHSHEA